MKIKTFSSIMAMICLLLVYACSTSKKPVAEKNTAAKNFTIISTGNAGIDMIWIMPGNFTMGSPATEPGRKDDEGPQTEVTIAKGYWLGKTEITAGQWKAVMGESLREHVISMLNDETVYDFGGAKKKLREFMNFKKDDPDKIMANEDDKVPMYFVSWDDAMEFCNKLNSREKANGHLPKGYAYTLPSEAQWEYACRAGTGAATFAGPLVMEGRQAAVLNDIAWYGANNAVSYQGKKLGNSGAGPRNAGEKKPNAWGLQDMPGNLWEWCRDWYAAYPGGHITESGMPASGSGRVNRGGSWGSAAAAERSASRASNPPAEKSAYRGFRIALCVS
jgi:formylglycine-generating enzyme required for sulfatase activity